MKDDSDINRFEIERNGKKRESRQHVLISHKVNGTNGW